VDGEVAVSIVAQSDISVARHRAREIASKLGFSSSELTLIATAVSEIARNIIEYARAGEMKMSVVHQGARRGIAIIATDIGPGIPDVARAMQDGYSTGKSLGLGLPGAKRMMDEFLVTSEVGKGTTVTMRKWGRG
jgi:serine/threonine-protein kinase RsbT